MNSLPPEQTSHRNDPSVDLLAWTPKERETFFAAIEHHRRAVWQVGAASMACLMILGLIVSILLSPLFYAVLALALDVVNFLIPTPDLIDSIMKGLDPVLDHPETISATRWIYLTFIAALPGGLVMTYTLHTLKRIVREAQASDSKSINTRAPDPATLAEQRFANVTQEMALAAGIAPPRVLILDSDVANAATYGDNARHATVIASTGLLALLSRQQMQAIAGHLTGLIANGDVPQGMRIAQALSAFGLIARLSDGVVDPDAFKRLLKLGREALRRGASSADSQLILQLTNPFGGAESTNSTKTTGEKLTWREWVRMPLFGPIVMCGFFGGMVSSFLLEPLLALVWRRRKYMADAIAIQFTRDPDALAGALIELNKAATDGALPSWMTHMSMTHGRARAGILSGSSVPMFPSIERRLKALATMGANVTITTRHIPGWMWLAGIPIGLVLAGLLGLVMFLLVWLSVALSGMFTWVPAVIIHMILR